MQHLIKRQTGMRAGEGLLKDKRTLAERLADARKAPGIAEPEDCVAEEEPLELTELAPDQDDDIEQLVETLADVDATDAIVQQAMAARGAVPAGGQGKTCLVVHHDLASVARYFDWLVLLNMRVVASGPTNEVFTKQNLEHTYGGKLSLLSDAAHALTDVIR